MFILLIFYYCFVRAILCFAYIYQISLSSEFNMTDLNTVIEGTVKFRDGKKVSLINDITWFCKSPSGVVWKTLNSVFFFFVIIFDKKSIFTDYIPNVRDSRFLKSYNRVTQVPYYHTFVRLFFLKDQIWVHTSVFLRLFICTRSIYLTNKFVITGVNMCYHY